MLFSNILDLKNLVSYESFAKYSLTPFFIKPMQYHFNGLDLHEILSYL